MNQNACQCLVDFLKTEKEVIQRHLEEHKWLRHLEDKNEAVSSFIEDYGWLVRELYCSKICEQRKNCSIAEQMSKEGDLLKNHPKKEEK
jgi:hypothetical protein